MIRHKTDKMQHSTYLRRKITLKYKQKRPGTHILYYQVTLGHKPDID